jgi:Peptidase A4 family
MLFRRIAAAILGSSSLWMVGGAVVARTAPVGAVAESPAVPALTTGGASSGTLLLVAGSGEARHGYTRVKATNWSGYAQHTKTKGMFSGVEDSWRVPTVATTKPGEQFASDWVGIGGYSEDTLVQAGTSEWNDNGSAMYDAWSEVLPQSVRPFELTIRPGDMVTAIVRETSPDIWVMKVKDLTTGKGCVRTVHYRSSGRSAEAIHERPHVAGGIAELARTNDVTFEPGTFSTSGPAPVWKPLLETLSGAKLAEVVMVNDTGKVVLASPSAPNTTGLGFRVADGPTAPRPPN